MSFRKRDFLLGHYIPHDGGPQRSFKPDGQAYRSSAPFDDTTMYKTEFTPKEIEPCPATLLESVMNPSFRFRLTSSSRLSAHREVALSSITPRMPGINSIILSRHLNTDNPFPFERNISSLIETLLSFSFFFGEDQQQKKAVSSFFRLRTSNRKEHTQVED